MAGLQISWLVGWLHSFQQFLDASSVAGLDGKIHHLALVPNTIGKGRQGVIADAQIATIQRRVVVHAEQKERCRPFRGAIVVHAGTRQTKADIVDACVVDRNGFDGNAPVATATIRRGATVAAKVRVKNNLGGSVPQSKAVNVNRASGRSRSW